MGDSGKVGHEGLMTILACEFSQCLQGESRQFPPWVLEFC